MFKIYDGFLSVKLPLISDLIFEFEKHYYLSSEVLLNPLYFQVIVAKGFVGRICYV